MAKKDVTNVKNIKKKPLKTSIIKEQFKKNSLVKSDIFEDLKKKAVEYGIDYFKKNVTFSKQEITNYLETYIEKKVNKQVRIAKREIRKYTYLSIAGILSILGLSFILYFGFDLLIKFLILPDIFTNLFYGLFLLIVGFFFYLLK